ncbi:MAG: ATP synthase F1 subunit gamma [Mycoplasmoidaceae bacterium]
MSSIMKIKRKIQSIETTEKITRTMKLVATANLKEDQKFFNNSKEYNLEFYNLYSIFANEFDDKQNVVETKKTLWIIFTSSLGLCGSYNTNIIKELESKINKETDKILLFGKKGFTLLKAKKLETNIRYFVNANSKDITHEFCNILADRIVDDLNNNEYDTVKILYNKFINSIEFKPSVLDVHPFDHEIFKSNEKTFSGYMTFESSIESIIKSLKKQFISVLIYGALIETNVSENSSRRNAMDTASKNAKDIKDNYLIEYNNKRQAKITQEINEITGGFNATK